MYKTMCNQTSLSDDTIKQHNCYQDPLITRFYLAMMSTIALLFSRGIFALKRQPSVESVNLARERPDARHLGRWYGPVRGWDEIRPDIRVHEQGAYFFRTGVLFYLLSLAGRNTMVNAATGLVGGWNFNETQSSSWAGPCQGRCVTTNYVPSW
jgi:hypothetical protein